MILLLLAASLALGQALGQDLPQPTTAYQQTVSPEFEQTLSNLGKDVRDLQSGKPQITGLPTFRNGISFGDSSTQTTAASSIAATTNDINVGAWTAWTPTWTGCSSNQTGNFRYAKIGKTICVQIGITGNCTSNATTFTMTLPVAATSSGASNVCQIVQTKDNGTWGVGEGCFSNGSTTFSMYKDVAQTAFTNSGAKAVMGGFCYESN